MTVNALNQVQPGRAIALLRQGTEKTSADLPCSPSLLTTGTLLFFHPFGHVNEAFTNEGIVVTAHGRKIAILAANPALTSVLTMVVAGDTRLRVRPFETEAELFAYMRIAALDMLVVDFDREGRAAYEMVEAIRLDPSFVSRDLPVIALTRAITPPMRQQAISAGIDEVVIKPMSPRHLLQRIQARLITRSVVGALGYSYRGPERRDRLPIARPRANPGRRFTDNVVPLFPDRRAARPELEPAT